MTFDDPPAEGFSGFDERDAELEDQVFADETPAEDPFEVGRLAGREEVRAELESERERLEKEKQDAIASAEEAFGTRLADDLAAHLDEALAVASSELSLTLTRLILPLVRSRIETRTIEAFAEKVGKLATEAKTARVEIQGPAALIAALKGNERFATDGFRFVETDAIEVTARVDNRLFETRLSPLLKELEEILA